MTLLTAELGCDTIIIDWDVFGERLHDTWLTLRRALSEIWDRTGDIDSSTEEQILSIAEGRRPVA